MGRIPISMLGERPAVVVETIDRLKVDGVRACSPGR